MNLLPTNRTAALLAALLLLPLSPALAQNTEDTGEPRELTLQRIMSHPDWIGIPPEDPYWADDGRSIYYERRREGEDIRDLYRLELATGEATRVDPADLGAADARGGHRSEDGRWKAYTRAGDVYVKDLTTGQVRQLTRTAETESDVRFLADGRRVSFRRQEDFFAVDLESGLLAQVADLRLEDDPDDEDDPEFLEAQQQRLFDVLRERKRKREALEEHQEAEQQADPTRAPLPWYLGEGIEIAGAALSPSGDWLLLATHPSAEDDRKPTKLAVFVTESGNVELEEVRAKVGTQKPIPHSVLLLDLGKHEKHELDLKALPGIEDDPLADLRAAAKARKDAEAKARKEEARDEDDGEKDRKKEEEEEEGEKDGEEKDDGEPEARPVEVTAIEWTDDGQRAAIQLRAHDNKDRWIATVDLDEARLVPRHRLTDPGWINWDFNQLGWLDDDETLYYLSEESGFSHLYAVSDATGESRPLTRGRFTVDEPRPTRDGRTIYYLANAEHPGLYETWRVDVASGRSEQVTDLDGFSNSLLSPAEDRLLVVHSKINRPPEIYVQEARPGAEARQVTRTTREEFLSYDWTVPEIVPIPSSHGDFSIWSKVYLPEGFDPNRAEPYPAVVFTHGAGYLQNVHYGWASYFREFMFHSFLNRHGYVVLDMDYRASAGYGRDWRTAIYRRMGHPELEDLEDGVAWLAANRRVDAGRVGTYGGSYGGFLTFMALFRKPDLFQAGAALRPVSDWAHYNQGYTSNILNTPELDPEAYEKSSPIEYAAGLEKPLLIAAPMMDDNVFFQDTVRLVQRLIELEKEGFETAIYPLERHGFVEPSSWLDEYRRIFKLFETHLK
jgi:dipeptidyl aminopeptidase/acylaminoacyl peptidase